MHKEWQIEIDKAVAAVENAKTKEERYKAQVQLEGLKSVINALLFNPKEMERLS